MPVLHTVKNKSQYEKGDGYNGLSELHMDIKHRCMD